MGLRNNTVTSTNRKRKNRSSSSNKKKHCNDLYGATPKTTTQQNPWSTEEDAKLTVEVNRFLTQNVTIDWKRILMSTSFRRSTRSIRQCKNRWMNQLQPCLWKKYNDADDFLSLEVMV